MKYPNAPLKCARGKENFFFFSLKSSVIAALYHATIPTQPNLGPLKTASPIAWNNQISEIWLPLSIWIANTIDELSPTFPPLFVVIGDHDNGDNRKSN